MTLEIAQPANLTSRDVSSRTSRTEASSLPGPTNGRQSITADSNVFIPCIRRESLSRGEERLALRPERSNKSARPFPFPSRSHLSFSFYLSLSSERTGKVTSFSLSFSFTGEELWNRVVLDRDTLSTLPVYPPILGISTRENVLYTFIQGVQKYALKDTVKW